jgi:hypothetical protein
MLERLKISLADQRGLRWQRGIYTEFAKMSVGRHERIDEGLKPPHIVVCGHTHHPNLLCISTAGAEQETVPTWRE